MNEWPGKDANWFRTFIAELNQSYRALEALRVPTLAAVQGAAMGGGLELALSCDLLVAAESAIFRNPEVTTAMLPLAGGMQRLADRIGRTHAARMAMFGNSISASDCKMRLASAISLGGRDLVGWQHGGHRFKHAIASNQCMEQGGCDMQQDHGKKCKGEIEVRIPQKCMQAVALR